MTDDPIKRALGMRRTAAKPRPWWRRWWAAFLRLIPFCDGDPVFSRRKK